MAGVNATETGNEVSQPTSEVTSLVISIGISLSPFRVLLDNGEVDVSDMHELAHVGQINQSHVVTYSRSRLKVPDIYYALND